MKQDERLQENIYILRRRMGLTVSQFARAVGLPAGTFRDRYRCPGKFRLEDIWTMERLGERYGISITGGGEKRAAG